jgi:hypothetical protein
MKGSSWKVVKTACMGHLLAVQWEAAEGDEEAEDSALMVRQINRSAGATSHEVKNLLRRIDVQPHSYSPQHLVRGYQLCWEEQE